MYFKLLRSILYKLIVFPPTYLLGMLLVRFTRRTRRTKSIGKDHVLISNFMGNIKMYVDRNSYMGGSIYRYGFHHINELLYLKSFLTSEMTFVDIGANQGEFSMFACSKLKNGKVIAIEPVAYQLGLLKENIRLNGFSNIEVNAYGLFNESTQLNIYTSNENKHKSGANEGLSSVFQSEIRDKVEAKIELRVFDDEFFDKLERIDMVKIDIEGAELFALKGMRKSLGKFKPNLIIEMEQKTFDAAGYKIQDVLDYLHEFNYQPFKLFRGKLFKIEINEIEYHENIVFISE